MEDTLQQKFKPEQHKAFLKRVLGPLPSYYMGHDSSRMIMLYFTLNGLDVLNDLDFLTEERKQSIINWIYSLQVEDDEHLASGFQSSMLLTTRDTIGRTAPYKWGHIASTFAALIILNALGDDFRRVNRKSIIKSLKELQLADGSFKAAIEGTENDMRFVYCACCISYILNDFSGIDIERMVQFILNSISYEGGIGQGPGLEAHCGSTFCAIASLSLTNQLHRLSSQQINSTQRWLLNRLSLGFSGRPNKPSDTCYSFWTGATLKILNAFHYLSSEDNYGFLMLTQDKYGGFGKGINVTADPMHTYLGLAGLSLMEVKELNTVDCNLNMTKRAKAHLLQLHASWDK